MSDPTPLDLANAAMEGAPEDDALRLRFFERLADAELFVLLDGEPVGDTVTPRLFPVEGTTFVLAFDRAERLSAFADGPAPYAAMSGRVLAEMLAAEGLGLGLNLEVAPSAQLLEPGAIAWLNETLGQTPVETEARPAEVAPPGNLPRALLSALDTKLALAQGLAHSAWLAEVTYEGGTRTHLLAFVDALPDAQPSLARAVSEALTFSGIEAGTLDVAFFQASDPLCAALARHGLRFDIPAAREARTAEVNVGLDPAKPPKLR